MEEEREKERKAKIERQEKERLELEKQQAEEKRREEERIEKARANVKTEPVVMMKQDESLYADKNFMKFKDTGVKKDERRPTTFKAEENAAKRLSTKSE
jgi:hypothetical protein